MQTRSFKNFKRARTKMKTLVTLARYLSYFLFLKILHNHCDLRSSREKSGLSRRQSNLNACNTPENLNLSMLRGDDKNNLNDRSSSPSRYAGIETNLSTGFPRILNQELLKYEKNLCNENLTVPADRKQWGLRSVAAGCTWQGILQIVMRV